MTKTKSGGGRPTAYRLEDGTRVPGVTTITNKFKDSGGLIHWAWQCGIDGVDYRAKRDEAGDVGHLAHAAVDADVNPRITAQEAKLRRVGDVWVWWPEALGEFPDAATLAQWEAELDALPAPKTVEERLAALEAKP